MKLRRLGGVAHLADRGTATARFGLTKRLGSTVRLGRLRGWVDSAVGLTVRLDRLCDWVDCAGSIVLGRSCCSSNVACLTRRDLPGTAVCLMRCGPQDWRRLDRFFTGKCTKKSS